MRNPFAPIRRRASSLKPDGSRGRMTAGWRVPLDVIPAKAGTQFAPPAGREMDPRLRGDNGGGWADTRRKQQA